MTNQLFLATAVGWNDNYLYIKLDGQEQKLKKGYLYNKNIKITGPTRVVVARISGTYVVLCALTKGV